MINSKILILILFLNFNLILKAQDTNNLEFDHLFIWFDNHLKYNQIFNNLGFKVKTAKHHGNGTESSIIYFKNFYLKFLSIANEEEFVLNNLKYNKLWKSAKLYKDSIASSPFGIGLHLKNDSIGLPFETFTYHQRWMREGSVIHIANSTNTYFNEPYFFVVPNYMKWSFLELDILKKERFIKTNKNALNLEEATDITILCPGGNELSKTASIIQNMDLIKFYESDEYKVIIIFNNLIDSKVLDLSPSLPLIIMF